MRHSIFEAEIVSGRIALTGNDLMARTLTQWMVRSSYACVGKSVPAQKHGRWPDRNIR